MNIHEIGLLGELRAARYAKKMGMRILEKRYRTAHGEIDIIAREGDTLVMIEVKSRPRGRMGEGARAVNRQKQQHLRFAAGQYLDTHAASAVRFDVIEISAAGIRHIKNAF